MTDSRSHAAAIRANHDKAAQVISGAHDLADYLNGLIHPPETGQLAVTISRNKAVEIRDELERK